MVTKRAVLAVSAALSLGGLMLSGCSGESADSGGESAAPVASASPESGDYESQVEELTGRMDSLDSLDDLTEIAELQEELGSVVTQWAAGTGPTGLGHLACEVMPSQLQAVSKSDPADQAKLMGLSWLAPVVAAAGGGSATDVEFGHVRLDAQMRAECPDVRGEVLAATRVASIDDLWDQTQNVSP
ncbi:hypothetical protein [Kineosporia succinea]|uniref:Lipoprotein n=1 Tax=Kineosporia succinea TaxID=84632 RepID=A0ABT9P850_9ACTN|nr:hypothetical protein [Kineosporia succinea]MDP9828877.1 hypothetical protein [Kineosporia succinea]